MRALVFTRPDTIELQDVPRPVADGDEEIVEVRAVGICGSELHGIGPTSMRKPPLIMGHELAGEVAGRRVTVNPLLSCGHCDRCSEGNDHLCHLRRIIGINRSGGFADAVAVPSTALRDLDPALAFESGALVEPLANAVHTVRLAAAPSDARIGILGAGAVGLLSLLVALRRTPHVDVCDLAPHRLEVATALGADRVGPTLSGDYDVVIDAVGAEATHRASIEVLRLGGTAVWVGLLSPAPGLDGQRIVREEKRVLGSYCYSNADFDQALAMASELPLDWATQTSLSDGARIFDELRKGEGKIVKAIMVP